uniref:RING-type domain-containing protein n=1 Tax=Anopheles dirus TaxID=7168 RepID=A0A182NQ50_9DIPT
MNDFLCQFPFLVLIEPYDFVGFYKKVYKLMLHFPNYPNTKNHRVTVFRGNIPIALNAYQSSIEDADSYVHNLLATLESAEVSTTSSSAKCDDSPVLAALALDVLSAQREHDCKVAFDKHLMQLEFTNFSRKGNHTLTLNRTRGELFKVCQHTIPEVAVSEAFTIQNTLHRHLQVFLDILDHLEEYYNNLATVDELCYVILPATIDTKTMYRVFKYNRKVFLKVALHPQQPSAVDISFFGPTKQVAKLRETYSKKKDDWNPECSMYTNLLRIFNIIAFPMRPAAANATVSPDNEDSCGICLSYRDADQCLPIISCDNDQCSLIFHIQCLKE